MIPVDEVTKKSLLFQIGKGLGESAAPILAAIVNPAAGVAVGAIDGGLQAAGGTALASPPRTRPRSSSASTS